MEVTRKSNIKELVVTYPDAGKILSEEGFGCIGCALAQFETLEDGAKAHGFDEKKLDLIIAKIKKKLSKN